jgi:hypothetical protein
LARQLLLLVGPVLADAAVTLHVCDGLPRTILFCSPRPLLTDGDPAAVNPWLIER